MTYLIYKCRLCGTRFNVSRARDFGYLQASMGGNMTVSHKCSTQRNGVADLVGERSSSDMEFGDA